MIFILPFTIRVFKSNSRLSSPLGLEVAAPILRMANRIGFQLLGAPKPQRARARLGRSLVQAMHGAAAAREAGFERARVSRLQSGKEPAGWDPVAAATDKGWAPVRHCHVALMPRGTHPECATHSMSARSLSVGHVRLTNGSFLRAEGREESENALVRWLWFGAGTGSRKTEMKGDAPGDADLRSARRCRR